MGRHIFSCLAWTVDGCLRPETLVKVLRMSPTENNISDWSNVIDLLNRKWQMKYFCSSISLQAYLLSPDEICVHVHDDKNQADPTLLFPI